jgi:Protein of unknown function (DUF3617)
MRNIFLIVVVSLFGCATFFGGDNYQPLNVKTGLWQVTENTVAKGLPPSMAAMANHTNTYQTCITPEKLKENPFTDEKCTWTLINSNSSEMEVKGTACRSGSNLGTLADVHYKLHAVDSEHVNGSGDWAATVEGQPMSGTITGSGHWVSSSCGDVH